MQEHIANLIDDAWFDYQCAITIADALKTKQAYNEVSSAYSNYKRVLLACALKLHKEECNVNCDWL
jgi:hypothetical protein